VTERERKKSSGHSETNCTVGKRFNFIIGNCNLNRQTKKIAVSSSFHSTFDNPAIVAMSLNNAVFMVAFFCMITISSAFFAGIRQQSNKFMRANNNLQMVVTEVTSIAGLDQIVSTAGNKLVVVDYSTTWCGPCKLVLPKYMELSDKFANVIFLKCIGDASTEASALMKREGVRSVPTFHMWKAGSRVDVVNGARIEEVR
jgi:thioredoxin 1